MSAVRHRLRARELPPRSWRAIQPIPRSPPPLLYRRAFSSLLDCVPSVLIPPVVFTGLVLALWTWKCAMMVVFQDKIIYMPSMPPFARRERVEDYTDASGVCKGVQWEETRIKSLDGVGLSVLVGKVEEEEHDIPSTVPHGMLAMSSGQKDVFIVYFQGNGSSLPPRLPILSAVLNSVHKRTATAAAPAPINTHTPPPRYTLHALSYRGYWTSTGRATQSGIELDAQALLQHIVSISTLPSSTPGTGTRRCSEIILWGQSIGAGVATTAAASYIQYQQHQRHSQSPQITALVLETPFTSIKNMLIALYPQKWLPYRYLHPLLWNRWDSELALRRIANSTNPASASTPTTTPSMPSPPPLRPRILILPATRDEVVPEGDADKLEQLCKTVGFEVRRKDVLGALHHEASLRKEGQEGISGFIVDVALRRERKR